jgi:hypothetical protein
LKISDPELGTEYNTKRNRAKIDNNAFYGKFGEEIIKEGKTPYLDEDPDELVRWEVDRTGRIDRRQTEIPTRSHRDNRMGKAAVG